MPFDKAVRAAEGGACLDLEVTPGASVPAFPAGFNPWRRRILARVPERAEDGAANRALIALVAERLRVPAARIEVVAGARDRRKTVLVRGLTPAEVLARIGGVE